MVFWLGAITLRIRSGESDANASRMELHPSFYLAPNYACLHWQSEHSVILTLHGLLECEHEDRQRERADYPSLDATTTGSRENTKSTYHQTIEIAVLFSNFACVFLQLVLGEGSRSECFSKLLAHHCIQAFCVHRKLFIRMSLHHSSQGTASFSFPSVAAEPKSGSVDASK